MGINMIYIITENGDKSAKITQIRVFDSLETVYEFYKSMYIEKYKHLVNHQRSNVLYTYDIDYLTNKGLLQFIGSHYHRFHSIQVSELNSHESPRMIRMYTLVDGFRKAGLDGKEILLPDNAPVITTRVGSID